MGDYTRRLLEHTFGAAPSSPVPRADPNSILNGYNKVGTNQYSPVDPFSPFQMNDQMGPVPQQAAPPQAKGFLQRFEETPGMGLGLMQLGAGLASGKNWGEGIGRGFAGMSDSLQKSQAMADDAAYKKQYLLAKAAGTAKNTKYDKYNLTLKDGETVEAFGFAGANGVEYIKPDGTPIDPNTVAGYELIGTSPERVLQPRQTQVKDADGNLVFEGNALWDADKREFYVHAPGVNDNKRTYLNELPDLGLFSSSVPLGMQITQEGQEHLSASGARPLEDNLAQLEDSQTSLNEFAQVVQALPDGGAGWVNKKLAQLKTIAGVDSISELELKAYEGDARAQALLGQLRTQVVGPGVMTEFDALRVLDSFGGMPSGFTWNKENALNLVNYHMSQNARRFNQQWNRYKHRAGKGGPAWQPYDSGLFDESRYMRKNNSTTGDEQGETVPTPTIQDDPLGLR